MFAMKPVTVKITERVGPMGIPQWEWQVFSYKRLHADGVCASEKEAKAIAFAKGGELTYTSAKSSAERQAARQKLQGYLERRPYMVLYCYEVAMGGMRFNLDQAKVEAERHEKEIWNQQPEIWRKELPKHHLSMRPSEAFSKIWDTMVKSGYIEMCADGHLGGNGKLKKFGEKLGIGEKHELDPNDPGDRVMMQLEAEMQMRLNAKKAETVNVSSMHALRSEAVAKMTAAEVFRPVRASDFTERESPKLKKTVKVLKRPDGSVVSIVKKPR